jgi:ATP-dependent RNA helicase DOB1
LATAYDLLRQTAERIGQVSQDSGLNINIEDYVGNYKPTIMDAVRAWANGATFEETNALTDAYEGVLIRGIRRLHELLKQLKDAAKSVQSTELFNKFEEGIAKIERGIIFAASLYL